MKMKMMEGKFHEERLQLQQKHDSNVQKVRTVFISFQEQYLGQNNRQFDCNKLFAIVLKVIRTVSFPLH